MATTAAAAPVALALTATVFSEARFPPHLQSHAPTATEKAQAGMISPGRMANLLSGSDGGR